MKRNGLIFLSFCLIAHARTPKVVHVVVALCDNAHQGIIPVPATFGNGQDTAQNLYWGAQYGVAGFLPRANWNIARKLPASTDSRILDRRVFQQVFGTQEVFLVAEAWEGKEIKAATEHFLELCAGSHETNLVVRGRAGAPQIQIGGGADLVVFVGHNGLMDFELPLPPARSPQTGRVAAVLACRSQVWFAPYLQRAGIHPVLLTRQVMAPEAYVLHALVQAWANGEDPRQAAGRAYARYQGCSLSAGIGVFSAPEHVP